MWNQIQRQRNIYEQTTGDAPNTYKFTTIFEHTDGHQDTLSYWLIEGCYLTDASTQAGDNGNHDAMTIDVNMVFDNASLFDADGNQIPTADAGIISDITTAMTV